MKTAICCIALLCATAATAQTKKDTVIAYKNIDTAGVEEFGGKIYELRKCRYLAPDTANHYNPYYFAIKKKKRKHK